jgi:hypothetical protein
MAVVHKHGKPAQAAAPAAPASAAPGTKDEKAKKVKRERVQYPIPEGGLEIYPTDYDSKKFKPLKKKDFKDEALYIEARATHLETQAKNLREEAANMRKMGGVKDKGKAKRLLAMQKRMAELKASLAGEGVDVDALLASMAAPTEA